MFLKSLLAILEHKKHDDLIADLSTSTMLEVQQRSSSQCKPNEPVAGEQRHPLQVARRICSHYTG